MSPRCEKHGKHAGICWDCAAAVIRFAFRCGLLNDQEQELWVRRLATCPGLTWIRGGLKTLAEAFWRVVRVRK